MNQKDFYPNKSQDISKDKDIYSNRMNRSKYLLWSIFYFSIFTFLDVIIEDKNVLIVVSIIFICFSIQPIIKRFHDLGYSGWMAISALIPLVNIAVGIYLLFWRGTNGSNIYGPDPLSKYALPTQDIPTNSLAENTNNTIMSNISLLDENPEHELFARAFFEIKHNQLQTGLYAKCLTEVDGDIDKTNARYIKYRVEQLKQELETQPALQVDKLENIVTSKSEKIIQDTQLVDDLNSEDPNHKVISKRLWLFTFITFILMIIFIILWAALVPIKSDAVTKKNSHVNSSTSIEDSTPCTGTFRDYKGRYDLNEINLHGKAAFCPKGKTVAQSDRENAEEKAKQLKKSEDIY